MKSDLISIQSKTEASDFQNNSPKSQMKQVRIKMFVGLFDMLINITIKMIITFVCHSGT